MQLKKSSVTVFIGLIFALGLIVASCSTPTAPDNSHTATVGPSETPIPNSIYVLNPVADATIREDHPENNYGSSATLETDNSPVKNFLLKFNVTGIDNRQIVSATLRLYNVNHSSQGGEFHVVADSAWNEEKVTWNNAPSLNPAIIASFGAVTEGNWYEADITTLVQTDGVYSLCITSTASNGADYASREGVNPPELILQVSNNATLTPAVTSIYSSTPTISPRSTNTPTIATTPTQTFPPAPSATPLSSGSLRFAVIGDYGRGDQNEEDVATLVKSWNPDFIVTVGDNNYPLGEATTIDDNIGQYYHEFIYPYVGDFGAGADTNRFFPALGNHDWLTDNAQAYLDYFTLPNNERYYDFIQGPLHFFILDSDPREPDGNTSASTQALWLQSQLAASTSTWNIVVLHHSPYSSGIEHGSQVSLQWPYAAWGADIVLSGHDHEYERLLVNNLPYIVNGLGGGRIYNFSTPLAESLVRYNADHGALLAEANSNQLTFKFYTRAGLLIDSYTISSTPP